MNDVKRNHQLEENFLIFPIENLYSESNRLVMSLQNSKKPVNLQAFEKQIITNGKESIYDKREFWLKSFIFKARLVNYLKIVFLLKKIKLL